MVFWLGLQQVNWRIGPTTADSAEGWKALTSRAARYNDCTFSKPVFPFKTKNDNLRNQLHCLWKPDNWLQHIRFQLYRGSYLTTHAADPTNVTRTARTPDLSKQNSHLKATAWWCNWCNFRACKESSGCKTCQWHKKQTQLPEVPPQQIWLHCHLNSQVVKDIYILCIKGVLCFFEHMWYVNMWLPTCVDRHTCRRTREIVI